MLCNYSFGHVALLKKKNIYKIFLCIKNCKCATKCDLWTTYTSVHLYIKVWVYRLRLLLYMQIISLQYCSICKKTKIGKTWARLQYLITPMQLQLSFMLDCTTNLVQTDDKVSRMNPTHHESLPALATGSTVQTTTSWMTWLTKEKTESEDY